MSKDIIVAIDIGTSNVKIVIARNQLAAPSDSKPQILGTGIAYSSGVKKGAVVDIEEAQKAVGESLREAERNSGISSPKVYVNIGGSQIMTIPSKGSIAVSRADGEISGEDIERVIQSSQAISLPPNREVIHVIPRFFTVDGESGIKDALGMAGVRLEVDTLLMLGFSPFIKNLLKCTDALNLEVKDFFISALASAEAVCDDRQKELGVIVVDMGGGTTDLAVFEEGVLVHGAVLPIGSSHITNDIAIGLRISVDLAEKIKIEYGNSMACEVDRKDIIDLAKISLEGDGTFHRKEVAEIIEARLCEIFDLINQELKKISRQGLLPAGVVLTGGGVKLPKIIELAKRELRLPCRIGYPKGINGMVNKVDDPLFACAVGLTVLGSNSFGERKGRVSPMISGSLNKLREWFRAFIP